ncbi:hypothetical protein GCM10020295_67410 [Streptomyces cinereospinus]
MSPSWPPPSWRPLPPPRPLRPPPAPGSSGTVPGVSLLDGLLGSLEIGHPVTSLKTLLPGDLSARGRSRTA